MEIVVHLENPDMIKNPKEYTYIQDPSLYPCVVWLDGEYDIIEEEIK